MPKLSLSMAYKPHGSESLKASTLIGEVYM
jgi:hypothetical protein